MKIQAKVNPLIKPLTYVNGSYSKRGVQFGVLSIKNIDYKLVTTDISLRISVDGTKDKINIDTIFATGDFVIVDQLNKVVRFNDGARPLTEGTVLSYVYADILTKKLIYSDESKVNVASEIKVESSKYGFPVSADNIAQVLDANYDLNDDITIYRRTDVEQIKSVLSRNNWLAEALDKISPQLKILN